jgi:hypothetical protein
MAKYYQNCEMLAEAIKVNFKTDEYKIDANCEEFSIGTFSWGDKRLGIKREDYCVKLRIFEESEKYYIYVDSLSKCILKDGMKLTGTDIVKKIINFGKYINVSAIKLSDGSIMYIDNKECMFPLPKFFILTTGISWYNKYGFISKEYQDEIEYNESVRNLSVKDYLTLIDSRSNNQNDSLNKFINLFPEIDPTIHSIGATLSILSERIKGLDNDTCADEHVKLILHMIRSAILKYDDDLVWTNPDFVDGN